jgi:hypothetical protein
LSSAALYSTRIGAAWPNPNAGWGDRKIAKTGSKNHFEKVDGTLASKGQSLDLARGDMKIEMVGAVRFELTTSCTRNKRATRLRYAPTRRGEGAGNKSVLQSRNFSVFPLSL